MTLADLLKQATPGPWKWDGVMGGVRVGDRYVVLNSDFHHEPEPDEALIVFLRNHAEAMERVIESAREFTSATAGFGYGDSALRAALAAYDSEVGASQVEHLSNADYAVAMAEYQNSTDGEGGQGA